MANFALVIFKYCECENRPHILAFFVDTNKKSCNQEGKLLKCDKKEIKRVGKMARILAIDYGKRRTGLAVTDELQLIAGGLTTVDTKVLMDYILDYLKREPVERIVVGLPKQMNNTPSENMARIEPFVNRLRKLVEVPVEYYDERFTSVLAHRAMLDSGIGKMARRNKELVDEISATIILQSYMESKRMKNSIL